MSEVDEKFAEYFRKMFFSQPINTNYYSDTAEKWMEEHDAEVRRQTIEECAEIISKEMYCVNCPSVCRGFATNKECAEIFKVYLTEEMKEKQMDKLKSEMKAVKELGERIGYGNMIECAKVLWNSILPAKRFDDVSPTYEYIANELIEEKMNGERE